jgi:hypothetical protein
MTMKVKPTAAGGFRISQMELMAEIAKLLAGKFKVGMVASRHLSAITAAADLICAEFNRPDVTAEPGCGLQAWLRSDQVGLSSLRMAQVLAPLAGLPKPEHKLADKTHRAFPCDPDDFERCLVLLRAEPALVPHLSAMAAEHPVWAAYVDRWLEMSKVLEEELPSGKAPRLFRIMEQIRAKVRAEELDQEKARK